MTHGHSGASQARARIRATSPTWQTLLSGSWLSAWAPALFFLILCCGALVGGIAWPADYSVATLAEQSESSTAGAIARNNILLALFLLVLSAATAGIGAGIALFSNGLIVGQLSGLLLQHNLQETLVAGLLPHAVIEAIGLCMMSAAGLAAPLILLRLITQPTSRVMNKAINIRFVVLTAGGALLIGMAALIEDHVSAVTW